MKSCDAGTKIDITPTNPDYFVPNRFDEKTILITGGAQGLGKAVALRAAKEGANVVIADWLEEGGLNTTALINANGAGRAHFVLADVSKTEDADRMVKEAVEQFGGIDYALNNAGVLDAPLHKATDEYWQKVMDINAGGVFKSLRAELNQMLKQGKGGAIVNVGSVAGLTGVGSFPAYVASKHAVNGLTRNAAIDYAAFGIRVNSVNMAPMDTSMMKAINVLSAVRAKENCTMAKLIKDKSILMNADSNNRLIILPRQSNGHTIVAYDFLPSN
ncbi:adh short domain containing protein [Trichuris trichiura]|uniref:Adh short domain containing protein n=1 Tax=Trichuris trichiura TaxID=36087 RepID=A0A077Z3V4_TRITR|nr:adh short domain containing protein [Trichuris trichiura]